MDDLISRQVAIKDYQRVCAIVTCGDCPFHIVDGAFTDCRLERWLKALPSAQPEILACGQGELVQDGSRLVQDCISRQAAIDAIYEMHVDGEDGVTNALPNTYGADLREIINQLCELPTAELRWIPVTERPPGQGKNVLVTRDYDGRDDHNKSCRYVEVASLYGDDEWTSYSDEYKMHPKNHRVVAWMPLPEPWKGDEDV